MLKEKYTAVPAKSLSTNGNDSWDYHRVAAEVEMLAWWPSRLAFVL